MTTTCPHCGRPYDADGSYLCFRCIAGLRTKLLWAGWLAGQIQLDVTRQAKSGAAYRDGGKSNETLLVFDDSASEAAWILGHTIDTWADDLTRAGKGNSPPYFRPDTVRDRAIWMAENALALARLHDVVDCLSEVVEASNQAQAVVDRRPTRIFLTVCECGRNVHGDIDEPETVCRCGIRHNTSRSREINKLAGRNLLVTAKEAERNLGEVYGVTVTSKRILMWAKRGHLTRRDDGRFRVGDILDVLFRLDRRYPPAGKLTLRTTCDPRASKQLEVSDPQSPPL